MLISCGIIASAIATTVSTGTGIGLTAAGIGTAALAGKALTAASTGTKIVKTASAGVKMTSAAKTMGAATQTFGAFKAAGTAGKLGLASRIPTTTTTGADLMGKILSSAASTTSEMLRGVPIVGEPAAGVTNAAGSAAGNIALKHGASEATAAMVGNGVTTASNIAVMEAANDLSERITGNQAQGQAECETERDEGCDYYNEDYYDEDYEYGY